MGKPEYDTLVPDAWLKDNVIDFSLQMDVEPLRWKSEGKRHLYF